tara:strand:- start:426 stop:710 length:285 start_codon:yes stop_codon:yes gene_type:complete
MIVKAKEYKAKNGHTYSAHVIEGGSLYMIYRNDKMMGQVNGKKKLNELFDHMVDKDKVDECNCWDNAVYYEFEEDGHRYHGYECGVCGKHLQSG